MNRLYFFKKNSPKLFTKEIMSDNENDLQQIGDYMFGQSIGEGAFAKVRVGYHVPTKTKVAIKVIKKDESTTNERMSRELKAFSHFDHPFIAKFFELVEDEAHIYIIQELAMGGTLLDSVNSRGILEENEIKHYFAQLICAIEYLHHLKVMHRDLKAENVLLDRNNNIRLIDFGLCNILQDEDQIMKTACGSPAYAPPEMIQGRPYDQSAEVWSLGILLYAIANCELPFEDSNQQRLLQKIVYTEPHYSTDLLSPELIDLLKKMLTKNPKQRITLDEIKNHPFICKHLVEDRVEHLLSLMNDDSLVIENLMKLGLASTCHKSNNIYGSYSPQPQRLLSRSTTGPLPISKNDHHNNDPSNTNNSSHLMNLNGFNQPLSHTIQPHNHSYNVSHPQSTIIHNPAAQHTHSNNLHLNHNSDNHNHNFMNKNANNYTNMSHSISDSMNNYNTNSEGGLNFNTNMSHSYSNDEPMTETIDLDELRTTVSYKIVRRKFITELMRSVFCQSCPELVMSVPTIKNVGRQSQQQNSPQHFVASVHGGHHNPITGRPLNKSSRITVPVPACVAKNIRNNKHDCHLVVRRKHHQTNKLGASTGRPVSTVA
ncbi:hypothetical protein TRFO_42868 [Tritrichomonas foetus]|uniref:non-specific serine/threonine protein kinase n=1 Tax=Tritrichomonas foetus TaxID=1144522 RepID=A0A1J4KUB6_9EUKA|nr:hypothetical protein TRFO_42868 [Tritrichomonas foetus]|eukprot:OHT14863.1 hypothetical protein TRFO_42868 [Tritrichomonas foetus]